MFQKIFITALIFSGYSTLAVAETITFQETIGNSNIAIEFDGKIFDKSNTFSNIQKRMDESKASEEEQFIWAYIESNKQPDKEVILSYWDPRDKEGVAQMMSDPEAFRANSAFFKNIISSNLMATMVHGEYTLFFVHHKLKGAASGIPQVYAARKLSNGDFVASNGLADDFFYSRLSDMISEYLAKNVLKLK